MSQGRRDQARKKNAGALLRQLRLLSQPCQGQDRRCSGKVDDQMHTEKSGKAVLAKGTGAAA